MPLQPVGYPAPVWLAADPAQGGDLSDSGSYPGATILTAKFDRGDDRADYCRLVYGIILSLARRAG